MLRQQIQIRNQSQVKIIQKVYIVKKFLKIKFNYFFIFLLENSSNPLNFRKSQKITTISSPSSNRKNKENADDCFEQSLNQKESNCKFLHERLKEMHKKKTIKREIPVWIELSHQYRRNQIIKSNDLFEDLFREFNYLSDTNYVSFCFLNNFIL